MGQHLPGQGKLAGRARPHAGAEQDVRAILDQRDKADLRISAGAATGSRAAEGGLVCRLIGHIKCAAIQADQPPLPIPGPPRRFDCDWPHHLVVQFAHRLPSEPRAGLRDAGSARHLDGLRWTEQPLDAFQQASQNLARRTLLHVQRQSDDVIHHHMRRQITLAYRCSARHRKRRANRIDRERLCNHTQTDGIRDPASRRQYRRNACHSPHPLPRIRTRSVGKSWLTRS